MAEVSLGIILNLRTRLRHSSPAHVTFYWGCIATHIHFSRDLVSPSGNTEAGLPDAPALVATLSITWRPVASFPFGADTISTTQLFIAG